MWNHRGSGAGRSFASHCPDPPGDPDAWRGRELGLHYDVRPRHRGQDPLLFLDLRAGRRRLLQRSEGCTVLNLFSYTCGIGVAAVALLDSPRAGPPDTVSDFRDELAAA